MAINGRNYGKRSGKREGEIREKLRRPLTLWNVGVAAVRLKDGLQLAGDLVVMFDEKPVVNPIGSFDDAISTLCANPLVVVEFEPLSQDEAHER
ncbi:hypothetical protein [Candidatus Accumulibacter aalborgensis]|uniref:hypothetical protein n=1 Tax=Candidatus Accumulibacter aalborgensis TaxID=1860102 RepID=UPI001646FCDD|nr:hypothetical protein [Candidatus Accumulibacter aalborgensis]